MSRPSAPPPAALSIAGSDPTGGAGLQADLQVFRQLGVHGMGVVSALTVQDSKRVHRVLPAFPSVILEQLRILLDDVEPAAVKIGMLATDDGVRNVLLGLAALPDAVPVVLDPVLEASDGTPLLERRAWATLGGLIARATLVTPNLQEAERLSGRDAGSRRGTEDAARVLLEELGAHAVLIKGGHRSGAPDDLLAVGESTGPRLEWLSGDRIEAGPVHGTGCALSAAIAAELAHGRELAQAVDAGRRWVANGLRGAVALGRGARFLAAP